MFGCRNPENSRVLSISHSRYSGYPDTLVHALSTTGTTPGIYESKYPRYHDSLSTSARRYPGHPECLVHVLSIPGTRLRLSVLRWVDTRGSVGIQYFQQSILCVPWSIGYSKYHEHPAYPRYIFHFRYPWTTRAARKVLTAIPCVKYAKFNRTACCQCYLTIVYPLHTVDFID